MVANFRLHTDDKNLLQMIYLGIAGYFDEDRADDLNSDPVVRACLDKTKLASQPTISRFVNRMDENTLDQLNEIYRAMRNMVCRVIGRPFLTILDLDSTLLPTYGKQEGASWNKHYAAEGYHPLVCYDGLTGDLIRIALRKGTDYSCNGVRNFLLPILEEFHKNSPITNLIVRGDSGFATPELYELCEEFGVQYTIRLKDNNVLRRLAIPLEMELYKNTKYNTCDHAEVYGEFMYQASSWTIPRRVLCRIEKPAGSFEHKFTFIVTTRTDSPESGIDFYRDRGNMENFIKESKDGFAFSAVSSSSMIVNANRVAIQGIAYNIVSFMKRLVFSTSMKKDRIDTIRIKLIKIAAKIVHHSRQLIFKLCSSCPYQEEFFEIISNIGRLQPLPVW